MSELSILQLHSLLLIRICTIVFNFIINHSCQRLENQIIEYKNHINPYGHIKEEERESTNPHAYV